MKLRTLTMFNRSGNGIATKDLEERKEGVTTGSVDFTPACEPKSQDDGRSAAEDLNVGE